MNDGAIILPYQDHNPEIGEGVYISPGASVIGKVRLGANANIWFGAVLRGDVGSIEVGENTNIQDLSVVHVTEELFDTTIGKNVTIGHRAIIHGCTIHDNVLIGMGAIVMDGAVIEPYSLIGAGAVVTPGTVIPSGSLAVGSPARVVRALKDNERKELDKSARHYVSVAGHYMK